MSFLNKLRPRSMKRRKAKTSTTAGDIFRGTVPVPMSEPALTMAEQMAAKALKMEGKLKKEQLASALNCIEQAAAKGEYSVSLRYDDIYRAIDDLGSLGFKVTSSISSVFSTIRWGKK